MIFLLVAAALVAGTPLIAAVLVSVASVREDGAKSLAGRPPGPVARAARRLLQARVGGSGSLQRPRRLTGQLRGGRPRGQPERSNRTDQVPAPRRPADGERATRSYDALATPRG
jgi:hypothetical protein